MTCIPPALCEHSWDGYVRYAKVIISFHFIFSSPMALSNQAIENDLKKIPSKGRCSKGADKTLAKLAWRVVQYFHSPSQKTTSQKYIKGL
jgi:hypothetical protein